MEWLKLSFLFIEAKLPLFKISSDTKDYEKQSQKSKGLFSPHEKAIFLKKKINTEDLIPAYRSLNFPIKLCSMKIKGFYLTIRLKL